MYYYIAAGLITILIIASFFWKPLIKIRQGLYIALVGVLVFILIKTSREKKDDDYKEKLKDNEKKYEENINDNNPNSVNDRGNELLDRLRRRRGGK